MRYVILQNTSCYIGGILFVHVREHAIPLTEQGALVICQKTIPPQSSSFLEDPVLFCFTGLPYVQWSSA